MSDLRAAFRSLTRAQYIAIAIAMVTTLTAGLSRRAAAGQGTLIPDKPYYKVGETARIEYRLPLEEGRPILIARGKERKERMRMLLQPP